MRYRGLTATMVATSGLFLGSTVFAQAPHAWLADDTYDFGSVKQGVLIQHQFKVRNVGDAPLRISAAELSLPGMQARVAPAVVPPGAEGMVSIEWVTNQVAGDVKGVARIQWNDSARPDVALTIKGSVVPRVSIEPMPAVYLSTFVNAPAERTLTIRNHDERPLVITGVKPGPHVAASLATVKAGREFTLTVRDAPDTPVGRYEASVTLLTDDPATGPITLPVHLWVKANLYANPDTVDFGTIRREDVQRVDAADALLTQTLFLKRRAGHFEIASIASDSPVVALTRSPLGSSESFAIDVRLQPDALTLGKINAKLRVVTNDPDSPEIVIPITATVL